MPKILWLVSITLPQAAAAVGLASDQVGGGWLAGMLDALAPQLRLTVASVDARAKTPLSGEKDGVRFAVLPAADGFDGLLAGEAPDLVHIWGTEYAAAAAMQQAAARRGLPVLVGMQGVMSDCSAHLCDGVPQPYLHSGRTGFDRRAVAVLAPHARYYPCNETLRPAFWQAAGSWRAREFGRAPVILMSQGNYPLKNLHTALLALPALLRRWPGAVLRVAGWPPLDKGPLLRPVIRILFPYQTWCARLIAQNGLAGHVQYTGPLQAAEMRQAYLDADLFLLPSYSENSPNSLGEAMLLGLPCVASRVGGVPDVTGGGAGAVLYGPAGDADALAAAAASVLGLPDHGAALGKKASALARAQHDPAANAARMLCIYGQVLQAEQEAGYD